MQRINDEQFGRTSLQVRTLKSSGLRQTRRGLDRGLDAVWTAVWTRFGRGTNPRGEEMAAACLGTDSQVLATILDPFRAIFVDLGPDRLSAT